MKGPGLRCVRKEREVKGKGPGRQGTPLPLSLQDVPTPIIGHPSDLSRARRRRDMLAGQIVTLFPQWKSNLGDHSTCL